MGFRISDFGFRISERVLRVSTVPLWKSHFHASGRRSRDLPRQVFAIEGVAQEDLSDNTLDKMTVCSNGRANPKSEIRNPKSLTFIVCAHFLALALFFSNPSTAQTSDFVDLLVQQRTTTRIAELLEETGGRVELRPHQPMYEITSYRLWMEQNLYIRRARVDSLAVAAAQADADSIASVVPEMVWQKVSADDQGEFLSQYQEVFWHAIGAPHPSDTLSTSHFRARLNGLFGAPTRNAAAAEQEEYAGSEYVQFEYWLIVNDAIPVLVLDTDGPFGRGLLIATDESFADDFARLKTDLFDRLGGTDPTPFADYYHSLDLQKWFRTGFDGTEYFVQETRRPRWAVSRSRNEKWQIFR